MLRFVKELFVDDLTAIVEAARKNDVKKVKRLLEKGADVNYVVKDPNDNDGYPYPEGTTGFTALSEACSLALPTPNLENDRTECVEALLKAKADPNFINRYDSPLLSAARNGHIRIMQLLLESKADPNKYDRNGHQFPLMAAACNMKANAAECTALLLEAKADPTLKDLYGTTAQKFSSDSKAVKILSQYLSQKTKQQPEQEENQEENHKEDVCSINNGLR